MPIQDYLKTAEEIYEEARPTIWNHHSKYHTELEHPKSPVDENYLQFLASSRRFFDDWKSEESFGEESDISRIFEGLAKKWKRQTGDYSILARRYKHPSYKAILDLGAEVIPEILKELRREPDRWFDALRRLTNEDPARGVKTFYEAVDRWLAWGISQDHIHDA